MKQRWIQEYSMQMKKTEGKRYKNIFRKFPNSCCHANSRRMRLSMPSSLKNMVSKAERSCLWMVSPGLQGSSGSTGGNSRKMIRNRGFAHLRSPFQHLPNNKSPMWVGSMDTNGRVLHITCSVHECGNRTRRQFALRLQNTLYLCRVTANSRWAGV